MWAVAVPLKKKKKLIIARISKLTLEILQQVKYISNSFFFFFKQKTAYEMVRSDWSSDVCSSDLATASVAVPPLLIARNSVQPTRNAGRRSEERRVGKECFVPCRSRWSPYH